MTRFKTFTYEWDTEDVTARPKCTFTGMWSRSDIDRMHKISMREFKKYKSDLLRTLKKEEKDAPRTAKSRSK